MNQRRARSRLAVPVALTALLLCARLLSVPALSDPVAGAAPASLRLHAPGLYVVLAPLFTLWDGVSMLSMSRLIGFLSGLVLLYVAWRIVRLIRGARLSFLKELSSFVVSLALFTGFVISGAIWHRPMISLAGTDPEDIVVDFHSHTNVSHDVRDTWMRWFDAAANRRWHSRAGFDAVFITDHNTVEGLGARGEGLGARDPEPGTGDRGKQTYLCPGIEVSAWKAHIVMLGDTMPVDRSRYNKSLDGLLALLATSDSAYGALSVASLPEYRRYHWERLSRLAAAGLDGFEIVNASPKANELTRTERDSVIEIARAGNQFLVGVSDGHGWGATSMVWNLVRAPGHTAGDPCSAVLRQLRTGFPAVRIVERHRLRPDDWWPMWLTPVGAVWETWRSMGWELTAAWLAWIWIWIWILGRRRRRRD
jgi:uncharacterized membrane protein